MPDCRCRCPLRSAVNWFTAYQKRCSITAMLSRNLPLFPNLRFEDARRHGDFVLTVAKWAKKLMVAVTIPFACPSALRNASFRPINICCKSQQPMVKNHRTCSSIYARFVHGRKRVFSGGGESH